MKKIKLFGFWILGVIILISPALYNGYPLVYSDTGTYIESGMELYIPIDRPIFYGLFIRIFSLNISLWFVIIFQSLMLLYILKSFTHLFIPNMKKVTFLILISSLIFFSGLGWYSSQIMPDVFTPIAIMGSIILLTNKNDSKTHLLLTIVITLIALVVHFSNPLIVLGTMTFMLFIKYLFKPYFNSIHLVQFILPLSMIIGSVFIVFTVNYAVEGKFQLSKSSHVFLMGRMIDTGVLKSYLNENCKDNDYVLCPYKDSLPESSRSLMWSNNSPLQKKGWEANKEPYNEILNGIYTSPKHVGSFFINSLVNTFSQLLQNDIGSGIISDFYRSPNSPTYKRIQQYFNHEINAYRWSRQNGNLWKQSLDFTTISICYKFIYFFSFILLLVIITSKKIVRQLNDTILYLLVFAVSSIFFNALVVAFLSCVCDRFQARVSWLLPFCIALFIIMHKKLLKRFWFNSLKNRT